MSGWWKCNYLLVIHHILFTTVQIQGQPVLKMLLLMMLHKTSPMINLNQFILSIMLFRRTIIFTKYCVMLLQEITRWVKTCEFSCYMWWACCAQWKRVVMMNGSKKMVQSSRNWGMLWKYWIVCVHMKKMKKFHWFSWCCKGTALFFIPSWNVWTGSSSWIIQFGCKVVHGYFW